MSSNVSALQHTNSLSYRSAAFEPGGLQLLGRFLDSLVENQVGLSLSNDETAIESFILPSLLDLFTGLMGMLHPEQFRQLLMRFYEKLRSIESSLVEDKENGTWTDNKIRIVENCCFTIVRMSERLAVSPCYFDVNYAEEHSGNWSPKRAAQATWLGAVRKHGRR